MENKALLRHPAMRTLEKAIRKEVLQQVLASSMLLLAGIVLLALQFGKSTLLSIIGLGFILISTQMTFKATRLLAKKYHPILDILRQRPQEVVWIYSVVTQRMPFGLQLFKNGILYLHLLDGTHQSVSLPSNKLKLVSKYLNRLLPHASFGYTEDREQSYLNDPANLKRKSMK